LNYQAIGSGGGQNQIINRTVDFGASDAPMTQEKLTTNKLKQIPMAMGAVVVIANIPGININRLRLAPNVLTDIYLGKIKNWNDPRIVTTNPDLINLPNLAIAPIYRADGSGTTFVFTSYLGAVSQEWQKDIGINTSIKWPVGNGAKGNDGVAATVKQVKGAIGYVESVYASSVGLGAAVLKTPTGHWVAPSITTFISAANEAKWNEQNEADVINRPCETCYPIVSATYVLLPEDGKNKKVVINWIEWAYKNGDDAAKSLDFIPIPAYIKGRLMKDLHP
jgi:phosphate transport system substrate-binding protein